jgi:hypothetical protein
LRRQHAFGLDRVVERRAAIRVHDADDGTGTDGDAAVGEYRECRRQFERRDEPGSER